MRFSYVDNLKTGDKEYILRISGYDIVTARFDEWDRRLLEECDKSDNIADKLLALECMARRIERSKGD